MSSDGNSGKSKGGVWSSLRSIFGDGKPDQASEPEEKAGTDEQSLAGSAVAEDLAAAAPAGDAPSAGDAGDDSDEDALILGPAMQPVADEDSVDDQSGDDQSGEEKGESQDGDETATGAEDATDEDTGGAEDATGDAEPDGEEDAPPIDAMPEEAFEASAETTTDEDAADHGLTQRDLKCGAIGRELDPVTTDTFCGLRRPGPLIGLVVDDHEPFGRADEQVDVPLQEPIADGCSHEQLSPVRCTAHDPSND